MSIERDVKMANLQRGIDGLRRFSNDDVDQSNKVGLDFDLLAAHGISHIRKTIRLAEFESYLEAIDYDKSYPSYVEHFAKAYVELGKDASAVNRKYFEQFLSIGMTTPGSGDVTADIAAASGPFSNIIKSYCDVETSYHQDLNRVNVRAHPYLGDDQSKATLVQCNATHLPFENEEISYMYLLNSWEHFQAPADFDFLIEAERCLRPGGKMIIVPLNRARHGYVVTDPELWSSKQVYEAGKQPVFRKDVPVNLTQIGQVYEQFHDARLLVEFAAKTSKLVYEVITISLDEERPWFQEKSWDVLVVQKQSG